MTNQQKKQSLSDMVEPLVDEILQAGGSGLRFYSMHKTIEDMFRVAKVALFNAYMLGKEERENR